MIDLPPHQLLCYLIIWLWLLFPEICMVPINTTNSIIFKYASITKNQQKLLAHNHVFDTFNYLRTPLALLGTKVIVHERPHQCPSFGKHRLPGYMVDISNNHFRSLMIIFEKKEEQDYLMQLNYYLLNLSCQKYH